MCLFSSCTFSCFLCVWLLCVCLPSRLASGGKPTSVANRDSVFDLVDDMCTSRHHIIWATDVKVGSNGPTSCTPTSPETRLSSRSDSIAGFLYGPGIGSEGVLGVERRPLLQYNIQVRLARVVVTGWQNARDEGSESRASLGTQEKAHKLKIYGRE